MRRKHVVRPRRLQGFFQAQFLFRHQDADPLDGLKRGVAFVHVEDGGLQAEGFQHPQSADTEHDLWQILVMTAGVNWPVMSR